MGEILPNGEIQGYSRRCEYCPAIIQVNIQGDIISRHNCCELILAIDSVSGDDSCEKFADEDSANDAFNKIISDMEYFNENGEL